MRVQRLSTTHFRNLEHDPILFSPGVNLFVGDNGQGKTNVLEAINLFKFGRSFRTSRDADMIRFSEPFCRAEVAVEYEEGYLETLSASVERGGAKKIKLNEKEIPTLAELVGHYPCVLFGPQDLILVSGAPAERRRFLDMTGSMTDRLYFDELRAYRRVLTQRNAFFKSTSTRTARRVWDERLVTHGCALIEKRIAVVEALSQNLVSHINALGITWSVKLAYESNLGDHVPEGINREEQFTARLADVEEEEMRRRTTLVGPHRDDLCIVLDGRDVRRYGSQGQRRLWAVLLRLAELSYLEDKLGEPCVLLLDDLFSELDTDVSGRLRRLLENDHQIFCHLAGTDGLGGNSND